MATIEVHNLEKTYKDGTKALDGLSFEVGKGESVVILGHNGSGKSTLFRCLTGFEKPSAGSIAINGYSLAQSKGQQGKVRQMRKKVGMVFQHFNLVNNLSVFQNVLFGALGEVRPFFKTFSPFASRELRLKAMESLDRVGLSHLAGRRADQISGGQKQRVAIARMLMQDPEIVLADEPIASLDPKAGKEVMALLGEIVKEQNLTLLCVLHQVDIGLEYGDRIIGLKEGQKVLDRSVDTLSSKGLESLYETDTTPKEVIDYGKYKAL